ncbi:MAG: restriction endonuclease subunit S [Muribaculaceae bacterium]|nr:restriction endonuclease subunit S [Muribaculaceae bacterium]
MPLYLHGKYYEHINGLPIEVDCETQFPQSWQLCRLSFICQLIDGTKTKGKHICLDAKYLRGKSTGATMEQGKFVSKGDNIILVDGENSGEVFTVPTDGYMGSTFKQLWVSETMNLHYVLIVIRFFKEMLRNTKKGAAIPHLNKQLFYNIIVGIPPIEEQTRIVKKTNQLFQSSV